MRSDADLPLGTPVTPLPVPLHPSPWARCLPLSLHVFLSWSLPLAMHSLSLCLPLSRCLPVRMCLSLSLQLFLSQCLPLFMCLPMVLCLVLSRCMFLSPEESG